MLSDDSKMKEKRLLMVDRQIRQRNVRDEKVLKVMEELPRHHFIPRESRAMAYMDEPVPLGLGQTISQPYIVALMTEKLDLQPEHETLEIGYGCGYQTAILARLCRRVYSIEVLEELAQQGRENVEKRGITNVEFHTGDGRQGWPEAKEFDRILIAAATEEVPPALIEQLKDGGKMVVPVDDQGSQSLLLLEKKGQEIIRNFVCYCRFVRLVHK